MYNKEVEVEVTLSRAYKILKLRKPFMIIAINSRHGVLFSLSQGTLPFQWSDFPSVKSFISNMASSIEARMFNAVEKFASLTQHPENFIRSLFI